MTAKKKPQVAQAPRVMIVAVKGDPVHGNHQKDLPAEIVMRFVADCLKGTFHNGRNSMVAIVPQVEGNLRWSIDRVARYVDLFCTTDPSKTQVVADMMTAKYDEAGGKPGDVGTSLLVWEFDRLNMSYDMIPLE